MGSFFTPELANTFDLLDLREVVRILERDYREADEFDFAPRSYEEAMEGYRTALSMVGEVAADVIAPRSGEIDATGTTFVDGVVGYAPGTTEAYKALADAGFAGALLPRRFGGLNFPVTVYVMMIEMVSRADASLMTLFGYQDVGEAIAHFGPEEVAARLLPDYASGNRIAAMVLTEPGGGSDLAAVRTTAHQGADGRWYLNGTKQFISNGNGEVLLVLARSEPKAPGMFGLSLFASDGTGVTVSRVEEKMGLHGSPTCELVFEDAPVNLIGKRRMGMVQTMYTLNHARFSVAAQALGIAEGAYRAAASYASERHAFGMPVAEIPAVAKMLAEMKLSI
ncbi:MAG: acyl-CoA dehydrogenase family protein, partial [Acidimicrobiia bacterium]|nr:acyl-CoA dehydrogenase family protein [Acidimicrobiia bacterium]